MITQEIGNFCSQNPESSWCPFFREEEQKDYFRKLNTLVSESAKENVIFPPSGKIFSAFHNPPESIRCIIIGQDPYHEQGQANGLAFSVSNSCPAPPSLKNIKKELREDLAVEADHPNDLSDWASQGVFLVNTTLTVAEGKAASHAGYGWNTLVKNALERICESSNGPLCVILWGRHAKSFESLFRQASARRPVMIHSSAHPSPLSAYRGFFGSRPFSKINQFLLENDSEPICWI